MSNKIVLKRISIVIFILTLTLIGVPIISGPVSAQDYGGCVYIWTHDESGNDRETSVIVNEIGGDYSELHETDEDPSNACGPVSDNNGVSFETPGDSDYLIYVYKNSDESWGLYETYVSSDDETFLNLNRGGIYPVDSSIVSQENQFVTGETTEISVDLENGQDSLDDPIPTEGIVEVYVYPEGESRPSTPVNVIDAGSVPYSTSEEVTSEISVPDSPGTYIIEARVQTSYEHRSFNDEFTHFTGGENVGTIEVIDPQPPQITTTNPESRQVELDEQSTREFSISASDPNVDDAQLDISWYVNNKKVASGEQFEFDGSQFGDGNYDIQVEVDDEITQTSSATYSWNLTVISAPEIENIEISPDQVQAGESVQLSADAFSPDGEAENLDYYWEIGGDSYTGSTVTTTLREVGSTPVTLEVENEYGLTTTATETISVKNSPPSIQLQEPVVNDISSTEPVSVNVKISNTDQSPVEIELLSDGETVDTERVSGSQTNATVNLIFDAKSPGPYNLEVIARDSHGGSESSTTRVEIPSRSPVFDSVSPSNEFQQIQSGEKITFQANAHDPDGSDLTYEWFVDEQSVGTGQTLEREFSSAGTMTIQVVARDEYGESVTNEWTVDVESFQDPPSINDQTSSTEIEPLETSEFVILSVEHPNVNKRPANVEIVASLPNGVEINGVSNVDESESAQQKYIGQIDPGSSTSMRLNMRVGDDSLIGENLEIDYEVRYYPEGQSDDYVVAYDETATISVISPDESSNEESAQSSEESAGDVLSDEIPGFTPGLTVTMILLWAYGWKIKE